MEELPAIEEAYYNYKYWRDNANTNEEWKQNDELFQNFKTQKEALESRMDTAQGAVDALEPDMDNLRQAFEDATTERERIHQEILDEANIDVGAYDPKEGPPSVPEDEDASSTSGGDPSDPSGSGSSDPSGGSGSGSDPSGGSGSGGSGSGSTN